MKRTMTVMILGSLLYFSIVYGQRQLEAQTLPDDEYFMVEFETLTLIPPLMENEETLQKFSSIASQISAIFHRWDEENFYNKSLLAETVEFVSSNRSDRAALTATLYLVTYLSLSLNAVEDNPTVYNLVENDIQILYEYLAAEFPASWQGKYSSTWLFPEDTQYADETEATIAETRKILPVFLEIEDEPQFITFLSDISIDDPAGAYLREEIIDLELERGNLDQAEEELAIVKAQYPNASITKQLEHRMTLEYEYYFDRDYHTLPPEELLILLTTSPDAQKVKYAAAGLGNLVIWWGPDYPHQSIREDTQMEVPTYIERAMSGDTAEREEMIDLIYRLWHLAVPALLDTLDAEDSDRVAFAGERLIYMKNEEIITAIIEKARATDDEEKKAQLVEILSRMNEPCVPVMRFRECLDDVQAQELYEGLVVPALEELQAEEGTAIP